MRKKLLRETYADAGWQVPKILDTNPFDLSEICMHVMISAHNLNMKL